MITIFCGGGLFQSQYGVKVHLDEMLFYILDLGRTSGGGSEAGVMAEGFNDFYASSSTKVKQGSTRRAF